MDSKAFNGSVLALRAGMSYPTKPGVGGELNDLREDVDRAMRALEARPVAQTWPELEWLDGAVAAAGGDSVLRGTDLLQGKAFASLALFTGTSKLTFTALKPGTDGNALTIAIVHDGLAAVVAVVKVANAITITANVGTHTANEIATAINANGADTDGYVRCLSGGAGTAQTATTATNLAGGTGGGWTCTVSGVECLPANTPGTAGAAALTETACTVTVPDLTALGTARAAGDQVQLKVRTNNILTELGAVTLS